jgi:hypothetical protein
VDGVGTGLRRGVEQLGDVEVGLRRGLTTQRESLVGEGDVIAEYLGGASVTDEFTERWKSPGDRHTRTSTPPLVWRHDGPVWRGDLGLGLSLSTNRNRDIDKGLFNNTTGFRRNLTITFAGMLPDRPERITVLDAAGAPVDPFAITGKSYNTATAIQNDTSDTQRTFYANAGRDLPGRRDHHDLPVHRDHCGHHDLHDHGGHHGLNAHDGRRDRHPSRRCPVGLHRRDQQA